VRRDGAPTNPAMGRATAREVLAGWRRSRARDLAPDGDAPRRGDARRADRARHGDDARRRARRSDGTMTSSSGGRRATASELGKNEAWNHTCERGKRRGTMRHEGITTHHTTHPPQADYHVRPRRDLPPHHLQDANALGPQHALVETPHVPARRASPEGNSRSPRRGRDGHPLGTEGD